MDVIQKALERFSELVNYLECECDSYNGFTCSIHKDRMLASEALKVAAQQAVVADVRTRVHPQD